MRELNSKLVAKHEKWYADHPDYVARMTERARLYLYYITDEVERRGMPSEIALLPMIESAFNPGAYSTSRALRHLAIHAVHRQEVRHATKLVV